jgi:hypothetical protein
MEGLRNDCSELSKGLRSDPALRRATMEVLHFSYPLIFDSGGSGGEPHRPG